MAAYLHSFDAHRIKVYQDGLAVAGDVGKRIVKEATRRGSRNYQLVLELLNRGAELCKTEDPFLLLQERENVLGLVYQAGVGKQQDAEQYRRQRDRLVEGRDRFIAATVSETLKEGETGVLLLGAYHNVGAYLPGDIAVEFVKDPRQVRAYFKELFSGSDDERFQELARHLSSPIAAS
ncbi:MAG: hypothetical protein HYY31_01410 [Chloroflexi bacterium]|nr:hypothetical protein [Chloroflexota bacterium]